MNILKVKRKQNVQYCFALALSKQKRICPGIKWAPNANDLHNKGDLKEFRRETMTMHEVLSNVLGKQLGQKECIHLIFISLD